MQADEVTALARIFLSEGGYTNNPRDPGGPTNWGITIIDARKYAAEFGWIVGRTVTIADVKAMPKAFAEKVYDAKYWDALRCDLLSSGVDYSLADYGVNSGIGRSGKVLRRVLGMSDADWRVTDAVLAELAKRDPAKVVAAINDERLAFLHSLPTWGDFGPGWGKRVASVRAISLHMAEHPVAANAPTPRPVQHVPAAGEIVAKGIVPDPVVAKGVATVTTTGATGTAAIASSWLGGHPEVTAAIIVGGSIVACGAIAYLEKHRAQRQEAPTPGLVAVPLAA